MTEQQSDDQPLREELRAGENPTPQEQYENSLTKAIVAIYIADDAADGCIHNPHLADAPLHAVAALYAQEAQAWATIAVAQALRLAAHEGRDQQQQEEATDDRRPRPRPL